MATVTLSSWVGIWRPMKSKSCRDAHVGREIRAAEVIQALEATVAAPLAASIETDTRSGDPEQPWLPAQI